MDQQNPTPRRVPTEEEIARAEAEAVRRANQGPVDPAHADYVPYVDDVPDPAPAPKPRPKAEAPEEDDDDDEYVPGEWEKRIDALPPKKWRLYQILGGALLGAAALIALTLFRDDLAVYGLVVAALLSLLLPRYLERVWRRPLPLARRSMLIAMAVGLLLMGLIIGIRTDFRFRAE